MLRLFLNGKLFWSANIDECPSPNYAIFDLKGSYKIDDLDKLSFTILRTHPMYSQVRLKRATFLLHDVNVLFFGKVCSIQNTYDFRANVECEEFFGFFKDDGFEASYDFEHSNQSDAMRAQWDTVDELMHKILSMYTNAGYNGGYYGGHADVNSAWVGLPYPPVEVGYTNFVGDAADIQVFDLANKTFYDVLYNDVISKCGGFFRMRVIGNLKKIGSGDALRIEYEIRRIFMDYLSSEDDYRIDENTGLLYEYDEVSGDMTEIDLDGVIIQEVDESAITDYDDEVIADPSLEPMEDWEDVPAVIEEEIIPEKTEAPTNIEHDAFRLPYESTDYIACQQNWSHLFLNTSDEEDYYTSINPHNDVSIRFYSESESNDGANFSRYYYYLGKYTTVYHDDWVVDCLVRSSESISKETIIDRINDEEYKIGLYVFLRNSNLEIDRSLVKIPDTGIIPAYYFEYINDYGVKKRIQLKMGFNWLDDFHSVSMNDIISPSKFGYTFLSADQYDGSRQPITENIDMTRISIEYYIPSIDGNDNIYEIWKYYKATYGDEWYWHHESYTEDVSSDLNICESLKIGDVIIDTNESDRWRCTQEELDNILNSGFSSLGCYVVINPK